MKRDFSLLLIFLSMFASSCKSQYNVIDDGIGLFDISSNGKEILLSYVKGGKSFIYTQNMDSARSRVIISSKEQIQYYNPRFSPDSKKIVFIEKRSSDVGSILCVANSDGSDIVRLTDGTNIITEASFSMNGEQVFFCRANTYAKYSPIGRKDAHEFDVYSIRLRDKMVNRVSNLVSYEMSYIVVPEKPHKYLNANEINISNPLNIYRKVVS